MSETIEIEVGNLYANLHEQFQEQVGDQYEQRSRTQFEEFLHNFNQEVERQVEVMEEQQSDEALDLSEADGVESIETADKAPGNQD